MNNPTSRPGCPPWCGKGPATHTVCSAPAPMIRLASGAEISARARRSLAFGEHVLVSGSQDGQVKVTDSVRVLMMSELTLRLLVLCADAGLANGDWQMPAQVREGAR